ncbi:MAG: lysylphosphatidylglycerol synthase domain-containing protein [Methylococcales bacterium]|nr:lysylphosphatidylglycerol synthase domain-containing protein [Methylococcales bacterium]MDD5630680.1 lysylphosphatidylglycerol synthase domain-containing protein [Methylococcales bacterium]
MTEMDHFGVKSKLASVFVLLLVIFFYLTLLWSYKDQIPKITLNVLSLGMLGLSILLAAFIAVLGGIIWLFLLRDHKVFVKSNAVISMFAVSQFGKYLPGNFGQHVGRVLLAKRAGISIPITLNTMIVEMMWGLASGGGLALISIFFFVDPNDLGAHSIPGGYELIPIITLLLALPWIGIYFVNTFFPGLAKLLTKNDLIPLPKVSTAIIVTTLFISSFFIMGLILKLQAQCFFGVTKGNVFQLTCLFSIAWLAGYLVPGAPAGVGVREAMMVLLLSPVLGAGTAVGLGITLRVTTTVGDAVAFMLGVAMRKLHSHLFISNLS